MARRRTSPLPSRHTDLSESEDELLNPSEDELFLDQEDPQNLFEGPRSTWDAFRSWFRRDPHAPKAIPLSSRYSRRQKRRERRAAKRSRRGGRKAETESSVMYEADGASESFRDDVDEDDSGLDYSDNELFEKGPPPKSRWRSFRGFCRLHWYILFVVILIVLAVLLAQSLKGSSGDGKGAAPIVKPNRLFNNGTSKFGPTTILISLDGFRADFLDWDITPALSSFVSGGVSPKYMMPSFPSVTFPNHWTLATGLYPESHGVVGNSFWDEDLGESFYYTDPSRSMFPKWWESTGAEPVWATAERQGLRSAVHMWPGSEAGLQPPPTYLDKFNAREKLSKKVEKVLSWLDLPSPFDDPDKAVDIDIENPRPQFVTMYVPDVDRDGHNYGPNSTEVKSTISAVDDMMASLLSGLDQRNLTEIVNVVVVSDHGMATTSRDRLVQLEDLVDPSDMDHIDGWPLYGLRPKTGIEIDSLYSSLKAKNKAAGDKPGWSVFSRDDMPDRWHFSSNPRIAPLFLIPDAGWSIVTKEEMDLSDPASANAVYHPRGIHGYDNSHPLMRAIFVARGPAFPHPPGSRLRPFQNTEVYGIVCQSLGISPRPNNGTLELPLSPQGVHGDGKEDSSDDHLPNPPAETQLPQDSNEEASDPSDSVPEEDPKQDDPPKTDLSKFKGGLKNILDKLKGGIEKVKGWLSDTFGAKKTAHDPS